MRIVFVLAGIIIAVLVFAAACGDDDAGGDATPTQTQEFTAAPTEVSAYPLTIIDDAGVELTFEESPDSIVALAPSFVEVLFAVGAGDAIVAADENTDYPPEAESIQKISGFSPSVEGIVSYEPDLVLIFFDPGDLQSSLISLGVPVMFLATPSTVDGVYDQIEIIGEVTGHSDEAVDIVSDMKSDIAAIVARLDDVDAGPSVFHEYDAMLFTAGPGSFPDEVYGLLKAPNIAEATGEAFPQMSTEAIIAAEPEVIVLADADFGESFETVSGRPGWGAIPAVQNERVYEVPAALLSRATRRLVDDIQLLFELLYPELLE
ncbi:MAG: ABC transporter substrate-binding protein [Chloroflexi bacterium]|nr:ABC transporter substrate-binding protein [Chloroflexota bacterium]